MYKDHLLLIAARNYMLIFYRFRKMMISPNMYVFIVTKKLPDIMISFKMF